MPSGAKKRKAAKKKMEIYQHNPSSSSSTPTHGEGDGDGKDSDVSSPASLDRRNAFSGGEEETGRENNVPTEAISDEPRDVAAEDSYQKGEKLEGEGGSSRGSSITSSDDEISFEEMKYRRAENAPSDGVSLSGEKTEVNVDFQHNNNHNNCVAHSEVVSNKENEEESILPSVEGVSVISDTTDECLSVSNNIPIASGDDHGKDSGVSEPLLGSAPHREQATSWKSCCGLFEVLSGSGR